MLHELCHIVRGPHDAQFYKLLDELNKEMDELIAKGFRGDGFEAPGRRVGEGVSHDVPPHVARQKALEAAQKRMRFNGWIGTEQSGQKLGGSGDLKSLERVLNPGQLAAMAAEKRAAQDRIWCGSDEHAADGTVDTDNGALEPSRPSSSSSSRAPPAQSANDGVRTERNAQPEERKSKPPRSGKGSTPVINLDSDEEDGLSSATLAKRLPKKRPPDGRWACNVCTLESDETNLDCAACGTPRPGIPPATQPKAQLIGWYCPFCMAHNADDRFRMCGECGFLRQL